MIRKIFLCAALLMPSLVWAQNILGDFVLGDPVVCPWRTFDKSGNSANPGTAGTLYVSKDGDTSTEKAVVADLSGTDTRGVDSRPGRHRATFPTTNAYFTVGSTYEVFANGTIVDGQTIDTAVCFFSIEKMFPLKGAILLHATEDSGQASTTSQIELTGNVITSDDQYKYNRLWDVTDGWDRAIIGSNAAGDYLSIYPDAPAAPTNGATLYITKDVVYPIDFFNPTTTPVWVNKFGATAGGASAITDTGGANLATFANNGGGAVGTNAQMGTIATNLTTAIADLNRIIGGTAIFETAVSSVTNQTTLISIGSPGADSYYLNKRICIQQIGTGTIDCAWVNGFVNSTKTWTLSNALRFTVAANDIIRIIPIERQGF